MSVTYNISRNGVLRDRSLNTGCGGGGGGGTTKWEGKSSFTPAKKKGGQTFFLKLCLRWGGGGEF